MEITPSASRLFYLLLTLPAFVAALTIHEFAHAWMANRLGDDTPRRMGRLTLDPLAHLDPFGSLLFVIAALTGLPLLAWAKPVPFNPRNLDNARTGAILIAIAGPISNLLQMPFWLLALWIFRVAMQQSGVVFDGDMIAGIVYRQPDATSIASLISTMLATGVIVNVLLAVFNMIPLPPLDGHYVLEGLGPPMVTDFFNSIRPWSFLILMLLLYTGIVGTVIGPFVQIARHLVVRSLGFPLPWGMPI
jgi:Zn-dependent protease